VDTALPGGNPPIAFSMQDADALVNALEKVFAEDCLRR